MTIPLRKLISITSQLTLEACRIIQKSYKNPQIKTYEKGLDDFVTEVQADYKIQTLIKRGLKMNFPGLRIIGEQSTEYEGEIEFNYESLDENFLIEQSTINQNINLKQACLWIDPIDSTFGFVNGTVQDVTVLVGLSINKQAAMGIIGTPFKKIDHLVIYDPSLLVGSVKQQETYQFQNSKWQKIIKKLPSKPLKICTSNTKNSSTQDKLIQYLEGQKLIVGGAGHKIAMVIRGEADVKIYMDSWLKKWDTCAGDAITRSMGGYYSTADGNDILYEQKYSQVGIQVGVVASLHQEIYQQAIAFLHSTQK